MLNFRTQLFVLLLAIIVIIASLGLFAAAFDLVGAPDMRVVAAHYAHIHRTTIAERN